MTTILLYPNKTVTEKQHGLNIKTLFSLGAYTHTHDPLLIDPPKGRHTTGATYAGA